MSHHIMWIRKLSKKEKYDMEQKEFKITMLGKDISIISDDLNYATLGNGTHEGIQTNTTNTMINNEIKNRCAEIHHLLLEIMIRLKQIKEEF